MNTLPINHRSDGGRNGKTLVTILFYLFAGAFFFYFFRYYMTGIGGPTRVAVMLVPVTFIIYCLGEMRSGGLYPSDSGSTANYMICGLYIMICLVCSRIPDAGVHGDPDGAGRHVEPRPTWSSAASCSCW
jgi:hypothetical protein